MVVVNRIPELRSWRRDESSVTIGAAVTYREIETGPLALIVPALAEASRTVGSPQIRNAGTLGGNLGTCSPAGDGLPVLAALDATVELASTAGRRTMPVAEFMVGPKRQALRPGELIVSTTVPLVDGWQGYAKVGVRNAMVIAVASACVVLDRAERRAAIALGSVGPTILRCPEAEALLGVSDRLVDATSRRSRPAAGGYRGVSSESPDHRSPLVGRVPPPCRWGARPPSRAPSRRTGVGSVSHDSDHYVLHVNGAEREVTDSWLGESLLDVLRDRLGLIGTKGACEQGECGSCSVMLDGVLVCSCLVMAAAAVDQPIKTIEGVAPVGSPSDVQAAFVDAGAVQCGFCTPGLIMAVHELLERSPHPSDTEIREELAGNVCRCTGYGRIIDAVQQVAVTRGSEPA